MNTRWIAKHRDSAVLAGLVLVPTILTAVALLPELTIPVPSNNDDATHYLLIRRASDALANGENVLDHWVPQVELGFPWFIYYQPLPALAVVLLHRVLFGLVDLLTVFNAVRYVLLVGFPITVFWSLRRMGVGVAGAAVAAAASPLLSGDFRYGFEYDSYVWRGFGMFTQLSAMHLSFITLATAWRALRSSLRIDLVWAALALAALVLTHLVYSYMMAITLAVLVLVAAETPRDVVRRGLRLALLGLPAAGVTAWLWLPFLTQQPFLGASPYLQAEKYDSYGAPKILGWLLTGDLLDHSRLPVITALLALGLVAGALTRTVLARTALALFGVWLVLYFGRPTLDGLVALMPMHDGLLIHRFVGSVELFAIVLIGVGAEWAFERARARQSPMRLAIVAATTLVVLAPAMVERLSFYSSNAMWMRETFTAIQADVDARTIESALRDRAPGRVFAGLRSTGYGTLMNFAIPFNSVRFSDKLIFDGFPVVAAPYSSVSLNADLMWEFAVDRPEHYQLFDVRYVVAPSATAMPSFLAPIVRTSRYVLYEIPTTGYAQYATVVDRIGVPSQRALFAVNRPWFNGPDAGRQFHRFDFPAAAAQDTAATPGCARPTYQYERARSDGVDLLVGCAEDSTLVLKFTYHPNWRITIDGKETTPFMVSPSLVGAALSAGDHFVTARYVSTPLKAPLLVFALLCLVGLAAAARWDEIRRARLSKFRRQLRLPVALARFHRPRSTGS